MELTVSQPPKDLACCDPDTTAPLADEEDDTGDEGDM